MKKGLLIVSALALALCGSTLMAQSNWTGTFDGDKTGTWSGTLNPYVDPPFWGTWEAASPTDPPPHGYMRGDYIELIKNFYQVSGPILDDKYNVIGKWEGRFPAFDDALASGSWSLETGEQGKWQGWTN